MAWPLLFSSLVRSAAKSSAFFSRLVTRSKAPAQQQPLSAADRVEERRGWVRTGLGGLDGADAPLAFRLGRRRRFSLPRRRLSAPRRCRRMPGRRRRSAVRAGVRGEEVVGAGGGLAGGGAGRRRDGGGGGERGRRRAQLPVALPPAQPEVSAKAQPRRADKRQRTTMSKERAWRGVGWRRAPASAPGGRRLLPFRMLKSRRSSCASRAALSSAVRSAVLASTAGTLERCWLRAGCGGAGCGARGPRRLASYACRSAAQEAGIPARARADERARRRVLLR